MYNCTCLNYFIKSFLPPKAKVLNIKFIDLDCDFVPEIVVIYTFKEEEYNLILKNYFNFWYEIYNGRDESKGKKVTGVHYRRIETDDKDPLYPASLNTAHGTKWGFIDSKGKFEIKPIYNSSEDFQQNNLAVVELNKLYGVIDNSGNYVVKPKYDSISSFSEGLASVVKNDKFKVINEMGEEIVTKGYGIILEYHNGRALFGIENNEGNYTYGYLDKNGKEIIPARFEQGESFKDNKAVVKFKNGPYAIIGLKGEIIKSFSYPYVGNIGDGLLSYKEDKEGKYGYIDEKGTVIIPPQFFTADPFENHRAVVNISANIINKIGLIDEKGRFIIPAEYNDIQQLKEGMASVGKAKDKNKPYMGSLYAVSDIESGKLLTDFIYNDISKYKNGLASAYDNTSTFFIDKLGRKVDNLPQVSGAGTLVFQRDLIKADVDRKISYLDKIGKVIWSPNTIIPINQQYTVKEIKYKPNINYLVYYPQLEGMNDKKAEKKVNSKLKEDSKVKPVNSAAQLDFSYEGEFNIKFYQKNLLVLELIGYEYHFGAAHGITTEIYENIDLVSGQFYQLKDLFKKDSNYVKVLSDIILEQIKSNEEYSYVWLDSYKGIKENHPFYISKDGLNIYFDLYEIAPYAAGFPTFTIPFTDIKEIINYQSDFWKSFN